MASIGFIRQLLNGISNEVDRRILIDCFEEAIKQARVGDDVKAENFAWFATEFTTHSVANTEFSVEHGMDGAPSRFIPSIRLDIVNSAMVPLTVTRAADGRRAYFKSSVAGATVSGHFE